MWYVYKHVAKYSAWNWFIDPHLWGTSHGQHVCCLCSRSSLPGHGRIEDCLEICKYYTCLILLVYITVYLHNSTYQHLVGSVLFFGVTSRFLVASSSRWICECGAPNLMSWSHCTKCSRPPRQDRWCVILLLDENQANHLTAYSRYSLWCTYFNSCLFFLSHDLPLFTGVLVPL